jgi:hypothetical protein
VGLGTKRQLEKTGKEMKKQLLITLSLTVFTLVPVSFGFKTGQTDTLPDFTSSYIDSLSQAVEYKVIPDYIDKPCPDYITKDQAIEDIQMFKYLIETAYSGKTYWEKQGVDFSKCYRDLEEYVNGSTTDSVSVSEIEEIIYNHLKVINDGHSRIIGFKNRELKKRIMPFFTDMIIEKKDGKYFVIQSKINEVVIGDEYIDSVKYLYKTLSNNKSEQYLIGILANENPKFLKLNFKSGIYDLPLHQCKIGEIYNKPNDPTFQVDSVKNILTLKIWKFSGNNNIEQIKQFVDYGKKIRDKDLFVLNLIGNTGGDSEWGNKFIKNLNDIVIDKGYVLKLHSPAICQSFIPIKNYWLLKNMPDSWYSKDGNLTDSCPTETKTFFEQMNIECNILKEDPKCYWEIENRNTSQERTGAYKGKVIIISNHYNASAGETTLAKIKSSISNSIVIGENSCGAFVFSSKNSYCLKNSLIKLQLTKYLEIHPDCHGNKGFFPDYWLDSDDPIKEVVNWINNPETYQFAY